jgi:hypothetical protein
LKAIQFTPTESKYAHQQCNGVSFGVQDAAQFLPVFTALLFIKLVKDIHANDLKWQPYPTLVNPTGKHHLDKLMGIPNSESLFDLPFQSFLKEIEHPLIKVNYDSGNSSALGFKPMEEFAAYGERIGSFHIKDRILGGQTVPLGQGSADFAKLRACLVNFDYRGDFVLQVARGANGDELSWIKQMNASACSWLRGESNLS